VLAASAKLLARGRENLILNVECGAADQSKQAADQMLLLGEIFVLQQISGLIVLILHERRDELEESSHLLDGGQAGFFGKSVAENIDGEVAAHGI
jgi:hypothetical protein